MRPGAEPGERGQPVDPEPCARRQEPRVASSEGGHNQGIERQDADRDRDRPIAGQPWHEGAQETDVGVRIQDERDHVECQECRCEHGQVLMPREHVAGELPAPDVRGMAHEQSKRGLGGQQQEADNAGAPRRDPGPRTGLLRIAGGNDSGGHGQDLDGDEREQDDDGSARQAHDGSPTTTAPSQLRLVGAGRFQRGAITMRALRTQWSPGWEQSVNDPTGRIPPVTNT
jgi:hypothetical protein